MQIPGCGGCDGLRKDEDGSIWLTKPNKAAESFLDRTMLRVRPGERRWVSIPEDQKSIQSIELYRGIHEGMIGLILGKGPSLSRFLASAPKTKWHVVTIGINEAATVYPCKYVFALDDDPLDRLVKARVNSVACLQPSHVERAFKQTAIYEWGKHVKPGYETAPVALEVAAGVFGIRTFVMVGFDGYDSPEDPYAPELKIPPRQDSQGAGYHAVNRHLDEVTEKYKLRVVWWHREGAARLEGHERLTRRTDATEKPTPETSATRS